MRTRILLILLPDHLKAKSFRAARSTTGAAGYSDLLHRTTLMRTLILSYICAFYVLFPLEKKIE